MGIFSRMNDIINSNINAILDRAEDPEKIIRMVIQEMEDTLVEVRSSAARAIADKKDIDRRLARLAKAADEWERKAELAINKGREDLAKGALIEKSKVSEMIDHLNAELQDLDEAMGRHEEDVVKLDAKLREARAKKAALGARHKTAVNQVRVRRNLNDNRIRDAFDRFEKVEQRLDRLEGEAESYDLGKGEGLNAEFAALEGNEAVEKELEALKAKVAGKQPAAKKTAQKSKSA